MVAISPLVEYSRGYVAAPGCALVSWEWNRETVLLGAIAERSNLLYHDRRRFKSFPLEKGYVHSPAFDGRCGAAYTVAETTRLRHNGNGRQGRCRRNPDKLAGK
jgi:hypothetical protein